MKLPVPCVRVLGLLILVYAGPVAALWAWGYRDQGWAHEPLDAYVRTGSVAGETRPLRALTGREILAQIGLPILPGAILAAGIWRARRTRRGLSG